MSTLVIAEHDNSSIKPATLSVVAAAQAMGADVDILVAGADCAAAGEAAAKIAGVNKVLVADNAAYGHQLAENVSLLAADLGANYDKYYMNGGLQKAQAILAGVAQCKSPNLFDAVTVRAPAS